MSDPKFQMFKSLANGEYYFHLRSVDGTKILSREGYVTRQACLGGIATVRAMAAYESRYETKDSYYHYTFTLKGLTDEVIGRSESYRSSAARDNGIAAVKRDAPQAAVEDLTQGA